MLVVSRKKNQRICFPNLGVSVEILRIGGNAVRVGVAAPNEVQILRGELLPDEPVSPADAPSIRETKHKLRNRLNSANLALHLAQKQLTAGLSQDAEHTLDEALATLAELDEMATRETPARRPSGNDCGPRALVVEDSPNERELLAGYLRLCGYTVDSVSDGLAAMTYLSKHQRPDLVLLDMQMPRMDGRKTVSAIRCNPGYRGIKLFAVSGMSRNEVDLPSGDRGVNRWFTKPLKPAEFAAELEAEMAGVG